MPNYLFQHPETEEVKEIFFHMKDEKIYTDEEGIKWNRIFTVPNAASNTQIDHNSATDFAYKTGLKNGTIGDLMDKSAELSEKRKDKGGVDPVKEKFYKDYAAKRRGMKHPDQTKAETNEKLKSAGISIS